MMEAERAGAVIAASIVGDEADRDYFTRRAEAELELAQASMDPNVTHAHYELAGRYLDLVHNQAMFLEWKQRRRELRWIPDDPIQVRMPTPAGVLFCES